jgi:serine/threonine protein kinase
VPLLSGDIVERYVIDGFLGAGGMGEVYRAHDTRLERSVALKIVRAADGAGSSSGRSSDGSARMLREARAAAALNHPNVVAVYDVGQITEPGALHGTTYIAMELVKGSSLRAYVGDASVPVDERVRWLTDTARALAAAHEAGIVHRDVKPENVMVRSDGIVKVLDFGIAKRAPTELSAVSPNATTDATTAGVVLGTTTYMAPEQLRGEALDGRADQFGWGVVAYELFAGKPPWAREAGAFVVASKILSEDAVSAEALGDAPPLVAAVILRALRKDRARRFASMEELIEALTGVFAKRPHVSSPPPPPTPPTPDATQGTERDSAMSLPAPALHDAVDDPPSGDESANIRETAAAPTALPAPPRSWPRGAAIVATLIVAGAVATVIATRGRHGAVVPAASSSAIVAPAAPAKGCSGHRACVAAHGGEPWICRAADGACVPIASEDCHARFDPEDLTKDDTVWLGAMLPLTGPRAEAFGNTDANVLELARRDFASVGGVLGPSGAHALRRVGLVVCDANANPRRAAAHLVDLETPAVLGGAVSLKDTIDVVANVLIPSRTLTLDLVDESPLITRIPQPPDLPRLVWRLTSSAEHGGEALAHLLSDYVEPTLRRSRGPIAADVPMKLAVVRSDAPTPSAILEAFVSKVSMNGRPLVDNANYFRQYTFSRGDEGGAARAVVVADIVALAPHAIVYADSEVFEDAFVQAIERAWRAPYRPMYVSEGVLANPKLRAYVGASAERRRRFLSVELPANTDENFRFVLHYNEFFEPKLTPGTAPGVIYDAFYVAAYAIAASGAARVTGIAMAAAMDRIGGSETPIGVGPSHVFAAYDALRQGKRLRLNGAGTQLELDHATGEIPTDFAVYCMGVDREGRAAEPVESGLRFDHRTRRVEGTMHCP